MNLYNVFNEKEKDIIKNVESIENRDYTESEISRIEYKIVEDIMSNSKKDIDRARANYSGILNKLKNL